MVKIIDGKGISKRIRGELAREVENFTKATGIKPKLSVVLVGDDPASQIYVRNKERGAEELGMSSETKRIPASIKQKELVEIVEELNRDRAVHGILVQLPLPKGLDENEAIAAISPQKDVDGLHPFNLGRLVRNEAPFHLSCTPQGIMELILSTGIEINGKEAVVVGRSNIVGKPIALMLLQKHATVTICHSRTKDLGAVVKRADIVVAAVGSPGLIRGEMIKEGAVVIDVGMNRVGEKLVGDVDFETAKERAAFITPVPGGVGPMTITMLLKNTLRAAELLTAK
jgi:methylenetetrahydrofolate dehydrogenase (NADP+)/methenyltetrahydrofolate cyclohydrolase